MYPRVLLSPPHSFFTSLYGTRRPSVRGLHHVPKLKTTSPLTRARTNTHSHAPNKKKNIQENLTHRTSGNNMRGKAPQKGKDSKLFGSQKAELFSATMTNQLCALAGSNSVWRAVKGERKNSDVDCRSRRILGLHLAEITRYNP